LIEVRSAVNQALRRIIKRKDKFSHESINWADLSVTEIIHGRYEDGMNIWLVTIEEASPDAHDFLNALWQETRTLLPHSCTLRFIAEW